MTSYTRTNENQNNNQNENQNENEFDWANHFLIYMLAREPDRLLLFDWTGKRLLSADWMA